MILLFNLDSINKELVTKIARKSYRISHLVAFLNLIMCVLKKGNYIPVYTSLPITITNNHKLYKYYIC